MAKIVVNINMFDVSQKVYYIQNDRQIKTISVPLAELVNFILHNEQWNKDIEEIDIEGNKDFIKKIGYDFITGFKTQYSNRNVRILTNGEILA